MCPSLEICDPSVATTAFHDALLPGIVDTGNRAQRQAKPAVDALVHGDHEATDEISRDLRDGIDLAWACVLAGPAADARLVDVEVATAGARNCIPTRRHVALPAFAKRSRERRTVVDVVLK